MDTSLGEGAVPIDHIEALHDLGYLPLKIKALEEGSRVNIKVPMFTVINTIPEFYWLTNYIETSISAETWKPCTTATLAYEYKRLLTEYAHKTGAPLESVAIQAHDFSFRGMSGAEDAALSGLGHLSSFIGTDTVAAIDYAEELYNATEVVGVSVPALAKTVFRPDSGDPVKVICGDVDAEPGSPEYKGAVECLWKTFGGTETDKGYKLLNERVGLIYGDSITLERAKAILEQLEAKGFASTNIVFGIGSYTYQYLTRDNFGFAMKATWGQVDGEGREIFKDPSNTRTRKRWCTYNCFCGWKVN